MELLVSGILIFIVLWIIIILVEGMMTTLDIDDDEYYKNKWCDDNPRLKDPFDTE